MGVVILPCTVVCVFVLSSRCIIRRGLCVPLFQLYTYVAFHFRFMEMAACTIPIVLSLQYILCQTALVSL
jgi:hypothetical protein